MDFNEEQLKALHAIKNILVLAGAGTGKTSVLSERFLYLLKTKKTNFNRILALTFTKKAAAEMKERIFKKLLKESEVSSIGEDVILDFADAKISTIDSFLLDIVKQDAIKYGIDPNFKLIDPSESLELLENKTFVFILKQAKKSAHFSSFISEHGLQEIHKNLISLFPKSRLTQQKNLKESVNEVLDSFFKKCNSLFESAEYSFNCINDIISSNDVTPKFRADFEKYHSNFLKAVQDFFSLRRSDFKNEAANIISLLKSESPKFGSQKKIKDLFKEHSENIKEKFKDLKLILLTLANEEKILEIARVTGLYMDLCVKVKRNSCVLTFEDLLYLSLKTLYENKKILSEYRSKIDFIMVDEFQDNNSDQRDFFYLLATRPDVFPNSSSSHLDLQDDKLFFVGDEKQSIYGFRGADILSFKRLLKDFENTVSLAINYRSTSKLIDFFNSFFSILMARNEKEGSVYSSEYGFQERDYYATYSSLQSACKDDFASDIRLSFIPAFKRPIIENEHPDNINAVEARYIAKKIKNALESKMQVFEDGKFRDIKYSDFAIIYRKSSNINLIEKELKRLSIPFFVEENMDLYSESLTNDFYSVLRFFIERTKLSFFSFLRIPVINAPFSLAQKLLIACAKNPMFLSEYEVRFSGFKLPKAKDQIIFVNFFKDEIKKTNIDFDHAEMQILERIANICFEFLSLFYKNDVIDLLNYFYFELGYKYHILSKEHNHGYLVHYDYLIQILSKKRVIIDSYVFLKNSILQGDIKSDTKAFPLEKNAVSMMTIHKSKGLEFHYVIVPFMGGGTKNDNLTPYFINGDMPFPSVCEDEEKINYLFESSRKDLDERERAEEKRVLYVAFTRAKSHLLLTGVSPSNNKSSFLKIFMETIGIDEFYCNKEEFSIEKLSSCIKAELKEIVEVDFIDFENSFAQKKDFLNLYQIKSIYESAEPVFQSKMQISNLTAKSFGNFKEDIYAEGDGSEFGTLTHKMLEFYLKYLLKTDFDENSIKEFLQEDLKEYYDNSEQFLKAYKISFSFVSSEFFKNIRSEAEKIEFESGFSMKIKNHVVKGVIDLVAYFKDFVILVDYKTDRVKDTKKHRMQLSVYYHFLKKFKVEVKAFLYFLQLEDPLLQVMEIAPMSELEDNIKNIIQSEIDNDNN